MSCIKSFISTSVSGLMWTFISKNEIIIMVTQSGLLPNDKALVPIKKDNIFFSIQVSVLIKRM